MNTASSNSHTKIQLRRKPTVTTVTILLSEFIQCTFRNSRILMSVIKSNKIYSYY